MAPPPLKIIFPGRDLSHRPIALCDGNYALWMGGVLAHMQTFGVDGIE